MYRPSLVRIHIARRRGERTAAGALRLHARHAVGRRLGAKDGDDRIEQRKVDDLSLAAALDDAQRNHHGVGAIQPGHHVGQRQRRQHGRAVAVAVLRREPRHRLHQRAEAWPVAIRPVLAEAGDAHDDQLWIARVQHVGAETHLLQRARPEILDQHVALCEQIQQRVTAGLRAQVQRETLLVPRIDLPVQAQALHAPGTQRIAGPRVLDLDHLCALIGQLQAHHVAGDQTRQIDARGCHRAARRRLVRIRCAGSLHALQDALVWVQTPVARKG